MYLIIKQVKKEGFYDVMVDEVQEIIYSDQVH